MEAMFYGCPKLNDIKYLTSWDVSKVEDMQSMFFECSSLSDATALDAWKVSADCQTGYMFPSGCKSPSWYSEPV